MLILNAAGPPPGISGWATLAYALAFLLGGGAIAGAVAYFRGSTGSATIVQQKSLIDALTARVELQTVQITELTAQNAHQAGQLQVLSEQVTQRAAVAELAEAERDRHKALLSVLQELVVINRAIAKSQGAELPTVRHGRTAKAP